MVKLNDKNKSFFIELSLDREINLYKIVRSFIFYNIG